MNSPDGQPNDELLQSLEAHQQSHILQFYDQLSEAGKHQLLSQLEEIDLQTLDALVQGKDESIDFAELAMRAEPPPAIKADGSGASWSPQDARLRGEEVLREGKVAVLIVAGGQGTRLGFEHPKGMFPVGPVSQRTLFEGFADLLLAVAARYERSVPIFIMTSPATHDETIRYLQQHRDLGFPTDQLHVFCQGTMPAVDADTGKLLLAAPDSLALSPDGHGGTVKALAESGALDRLQELGIEYLFYAQVDNFLAPLCDPEFLGHHILYDSELTTLVIRKRYPTERVGNVVVVDGKSMIIEYSDLPDLAAEATDEQGELKLWAGNIAVHVFNVSFLERVSADPDSLPFHRANKKVPFVNAQGESVEPDAPNAIKFERFIFDLLPAAKNAFFVEGLPSKVFAPVKNADGAENDTPAIAKKMISDLHKSWLQAAGVDVAENVMVEIHPSVALDAEQVAEAVASGKLPAKGSRIESDTYFH